MPRPQPDSLAPAPPGQTSDASVLRWVIRLLRQGSQRAAPADASEPGETWTALDSASLEGLVRARTADLDRARLAAEEANRAKAAFLANMSHELRTPMHAILSYAQLGRDATGHEQLEYFDRITARGEQLLSMLSDLLDLSRLEAGSMSIEFGANDVEALLRDALTLAAERLRAKHVSVHVSRAEDVRDSRALVDAVLMGKLFDNLLSNAVRYSPDGGAVRIMFSRSTLTEGQRQLPAIELAIADEGVGIPEEELGAIFDKFVQSSKTRSNAGGTGLGLAIAREIVALHGGKIWASNNRGPGVTLHVLLPSLEASLGRGAQ